VLAIDATSRTNSAALPIRFAGEHEMSVALEHGAAMTGCRASATLARYDP